MSEFANHFLAVFVPLFVALTPLSAISMFLSLTDGMAPSVTHSLAKRALLTAFVVALAVIFIGQALFRFLAITLDDLRVGGGVILLVIATYDLLFAREERKKNDLAALPDLGAVPIGTPLIVGPATMTTCVVLADIYGKAMVIVAFSLNLVLIALFLLNADKARRQIQPAVARAFSKVMSLFLAAIAVAMLRTGVINMVQTLR